MKKTYFSPSLFFSFAREFNSLKKEEIITLPGASEIVVTSVHGHEHLRKGNPKACDTGSLQFAYILARITRSHFFGVNMPGVADSNYYRDTLLKQTLKGYDKKLSLLVDIHASHACRVADIELGTMDGATLMGRDYLATQLMDKIRLYNFIVQRDEIFKGKGEDEAAQTMVAFAKDELALTGIQMEINACYLMEQDNLTYLHRHCQLMNCLAEFFYEYGEVK